MKPANLDALSAVRRLALLGLLLATSCARFPGTDGGASRFPRISFRIQTRGAIDSRPRLGNQYYVAIRTIRDASVPNEGAPVQVSEGAAGAGNGFVAGKPTHFIRFDPSVSAQFPYRLNRFILNPENPDDPNNLINYVDISNGRGQIVIFTVPGDDTNPNELSFDLFLNQLADSDAAANEIRYLQVNILTMNVAANGANDNVRSWDALGNSRFGSPDVITYLNVDTRSNRIFDNQSRIEPTDDVQGGSPDPSLDIQSFSVEVRQP
ncbi:hypothetical protein EON79_06220 [bacterium]|nr:MAG: hypothetical protein EON79_06220 [bacterium]